MSTLSNRLAEFAAGLDGTDFTPGKPEEDNIKVMAGSDIQDLIVYAETFQLRLVKVVHVNPNMFVYRFENRHISDHGTDTLRQAIGLIQKIMTGANGKILEVLLELTNMHYGGVIDDPAEITDQDTPAEPAVLEKSD